MARHQGPPRRSDRGRHVKGVGPSERRRREQEERQDRDRKKQQEIFDERAPDGIVLCHYGSHADVAFGGADVRMCLLSPKVHKLLGLCVGDRVWTEAGSGPEERVIAWRAERRNEVRRKRGDEDRTGHVIAANVDRMAITTALQEPPLRVGAIDRYLVLASVLGIEPLLVLTKLDRTTPEDPVWAELQPYRDLGLPMVVTSATDGRGLEELSAELTGRVTVFAGHSGVGKSSLCQALDLRDAPPIGDLSRSGGRVRGRHTTSIARLLALPGGGWVVDTPGVRAIGLVDLQPEDARIHFPEFAELAVDCEFSSCLHTVEEGCGVRAAAEAGDLNEARYNSYLRLMESLQPT